MCYRADLHVHSPFSYATSPGCTLPNLAAWAQLKGVTVVGTGDCTHPVWSATLARLLEPADDGLYALRPAAARQAAVTVPAACQAPVRFVVSGEVSLVYRRGDRARKLHLLVLLPSLASAARLRQKLGRVGRIDADGRPTFGMDPVDLVRLVRSVDPQGAVIPAHIWTPWFALLGSRSGVDSLEACFQDETPAIFAVETGLSSDAPMNGRVSGLDGVALVSNSDLHAPDRLGRNANVFFGQPGFERMLDGLRRRDPGVCGGTLDLYPEAGKYHLDGHRACGVRWTPEQTLAAGGLCPVCNRPVVRGVLARVEELADYPPGRRPEGALPYRYFVPLAALLAQVLGVGENAQRVRAAHGRLLAACGPELDLLLDLPAAALAETGPAGLAEAVLAVREGRVERLGGYDGEAGTVRAAVTERPGSRKPRPARP